MSELPAGIENPESRGFKGRIIEAIKARDKESLLSALSAADEVLTAHFKWSGQIHLHEAEIEEFFDTLDRNGQAAVVIYLGDGGISRLILNAKGEDITVSPSPVSSDKVKRLWEELQ